MKGDAPKQNRDRVVAVRLSAQEQAAWKQAALLDGRTQLGRWVRERIDASLNSPARYSRRQRVSSSTNRHLEVIAGQLGRIGTNLNQAVKALNTLALQADNPEPPRDLEPTQTNLSGFAAMIAKSQPAKATDPTQAQLREIRSTLEALQPALKEIREILPEIWAATEGGRK